MPGSGSSFCSFAGSFLALVDFFGGGDLRSSRSGFKGYDWLCEWMMVSHITAWDKDDLSGDG